MKNASLILSLIAIALCVFTISRQVSRNSYIDRQQHKLDSLVKADTTIHFNDNE